MNKSINISLQKANYYDNLTILFILLQVFGGLGGLFQPIRIFVFLSFPIILFSFKYKINNSVYNYEILFFIFWIIYGIISLLWAIQPFEGIKELIILIFNFYSYFLLIYIARRANNPYNSIIKGWTLLFIFTIPIALIEFIFDIHFSISYDSESQILNYGFVTIRRVFASVTYMNLNGYNTMLCYMMPFVFSNLLYNFSKIKATAFWILNLLLGYIVIINGSRAAFINFLICLILFSYFYVNRKRSFFKLLGIFLLTSIITIYFFYDIFNLISIRLLGEGINDFQRMQIISSGWDAFIKSHFWGVGAGNFMPVMEQVYKQSLTSPHNFLLEIAVQYGFLILVLFIGLFFRLYKKQKNNQSKFTKFIILSALFTFPLLSIIDSSYIISPYPWIFISSLFIIANNTKNIEYHD